jgi:hypothetical protein
LQNATAGAALENQEKQLDCSKKNRELLVTAIIDQKSTQIPFKLILESQILRESEFK